MNALSVRPGKVFAAFLISLLMTGCGSITVISRYDEPTDTALTDVQKSTDDFIVDLIADAPADANAYDRHKEFYTAADQKLRRLEFRVSSIPSNAPTVTLVADIRTALLGKGTCDPDGASLQDLHCSAGSTGPSKAALEISRRNVNQTIAAALALELAKKTGD